MILTAALGTATGLPVIELDQNTSGRPHGAPAAAPVVTGVARMAGQASVYVGH
ncbi:hypothetical protein [Actinospica robiniae]|uniref:hypothetical protein n=1 Tax=Actinospica robiniae TaxID=304901 RepID=UPI000401901A|nr:hypothetical protein [Actinospica robiniae]